MNSKAAQERQQRILLDLVRQPGNDVCADCKGRAPRWASWNLGIFICVQCAGVHRKMGTHISKVKSITLDTWTREQVDKMKEIGNVKSNKLYNPDEMRNRPPTNMEESERDSELEKYIRRKYEFRRFMEGKPPPVPSKDATFLKSPSSSNGGYGDRQNSVSSSSSQSRDQLLNGGSIARSRTAPIPSSWSEAQRSAKSKATQAPPLPNGVTKSSLTMASNGSSASKQPTLTLSVPPSQVPQRSTSALNAPSGSSTANGSKTAATATSSVFDDLVSLSDPSQPSPSQPPLQMNPWASLQGQQQSVLSAPAIQEPAGNFWAGAASSAGLSSGPASPYGVSPSTQLGNGMQGLRPELQVNTLRSFSLSSPSAQLMQQQQTGMLSPMYPQYHQQRSASLGTMAFSSSPLASPGGTIHNPFLNMQSGLGAALPQQTGLSPLSPMSMSNQQYQQQMGQNAFFGQTLGTSPSASPNSAAHMFSQPQPQQQQGMQMQQANGVNSFASSMMPSPGGQFGAQSQQQQPAYYQQQQSQAYGSNMW